MTDPASQLDAITAIVLAVLIAAGLILAGMMAATPGAP